MASRRNLKKQIHAVSSEIINIAFVNYFVTNTLAEEKLKEIIEKAAELNNEFLDRVNHSNGKENPKIVKNYFSQLKTDFNNRVAEICKAFEQ